MTQNVNYETDEDSSSSDRFDFEGRKKIGKVLSKRPLIKIDNWLHPESPYASCSPIYRFTSLVKHCGSKMIEGHYKTFAKSPSGPFYEFSDSTVGFYLCVVLIFV